MNANDAAALRALAGVYESMGSKVKAIEQYEKALVIAPDNVNLMLDYARLLAKYEKNQEAIAVYNKILSIDVKNAQAHAALADL